MPTPDFTESPNLRREILHDLLSAGLDRKNKLITQRSAQKLAHSLILRYLIEALDQPDMAAAFASAIGMIKLPDAENG